MEKVINCERQEGGGDLIIAVCFILGMEGKALCLLNCALHRDASAQAVHIKQDLSGICTHIEV